MTTDHDKLRELAEAATPGPWRVEPVGNGTFAVRGKPLFAIAVLPSPRAAEYIAAASPSTILSLLARLERAERERDEERHLATVRGEMLTKCERERDEARAERDGARAELELRPDISPDQAYEWVGIVGSSGERHVLRALRAHARKAVKP